VLGEPNFPATKNGTEVPSVGSVREIVLANVPLAPFRKTMAPPPAADLPVMVTLTVGDDVPEGSLTRMRHGAGAQAMKRAFSSGVLLICSSTLTTVLHVSLIGGSDVD